MKAIAQIEPDGRLTIDAETIRKAGFAPGESVELASMGPGLMVAPCHSVDSVFSKWAGFDRSRPPMSLDEIVAEQRDLRGATDFN
jgi:hypothetical protein